VCNNLGEQAVERGDPAAAGRYFRQSVGVIKGCDHGNQQDALEKLSFAEDRLPLLNRG
jgi:hypothetical protein